MADREFQNFGILSGNYNDVPFQDSRSSVVSLTMPEIAFEKTADQEVWFSGELTLTFTVDNSVGDGPLENIVITDTLDATKFAYIDGSLTAYITDNVGTVTELEIDSDYRVTYEQSTPEEGSDLLTVEFLSDGAAAAIPVGSILSFSFRGSKVPA